MKQQYCKINHNCFRIMSIFLWIPKRRVISILEAAICELCRVNRGDKILGTAPSSVQQSSLQHDAWTLIIMKGGLVFYLCGYLNKWQVSRHIHSPTAGNISPEACIFRRTSPSWRAQDAAWSREGSGGMTGPRSDPDCLAVSVHTIPGWIDLPKAAASSSRKAGLALPLTVGDPSSLRV